MANGLPYFKWFPKDAETDTLYCRMTDQERGFYHHCLNMSWINGGLPSDPVDMAECLNRPAEYIERLWPRMSKCFRLKDGVYTNPRQEVERASAKQLAKKNKQAAERRWSMESDGLDAHAVRAGNANALLRAYDSDSVSDSVVISEKKTTEVSLGKNRRAEEFWALMWPRTPEAQPKKPALEIYARKVTTEEQHQAVLAALRKQRPVEMAKEGKYRVQAVTWLRQERWKDQSVAPRPNGNHKPEGTCDTCWGTGVKGFNGAVVEFCSCGAPHDPIYDDIVLARA